MPSNPQRENSPHPTVIRQCCMPSNPQRETYGSLIQQLYDNAACQVIHNGKLTEAFEVRTHPTVIRQCCMSSNPQRETWIMIRSEDGSEARLSTITNDL
ncbi:unnamed protein product, partial [Trichobilharzia regenti]